MKHFGPFVLVVAIAVLALFGGHARADPHCCIPATCSFKTDTFTNFPGMPRVQIGRSLYDETKGVASFVKFGNDSYQVYVLPDIVYVVNMTENKCMSINCGGRCFQPYCTNATDFLFSGIVTVGTEKVSLWRSVKYPGNIFLQPKPSDLSRCIPIAFTSAAGRTTEQLRYQFMWWTDVQESAISPGTFDPPAICHARKRISFDQTAPEHAELMNYVKSLTTFPLSA